VTQVKSPHDYFQRLCALSATSQTSPEEEEQLAEHIQFCLVCQGTYDEFRQIASQLYARTPRSDTASSTFQPAAEVTSEQLKARERLLGAVRQTINLPLTEDRPGSVALKPKKAWDFSAPMVPSWVTSALAAALLLAVSLDLTQSWLSKRHSKEEAATSAKLKRELDELRSQLALLQAGPSKPPVEAPLTAKEDDVQKLRADDEATHQALLNSEATRQREAGENAQLQARVRLLQSSLEVLQASNASLEAEKSGLSEKVSSVTADLRKSQDEIGKLAARNEDLSQESLVRVKSVERQQKLLATDHDITEILGARSLHIIDVFDVSSQGEFERPFGRIFYTEGKSLIFYAFDLDQQKGLKRGAIFQAWGRRGVGREDARSLGMFYMDDPTQNRWVLKVDDSKLLSRIDYVFVTDNSRKENLKPKGKSLLSAFLTGTANHP
jgi:hypothetical protein